MVLDVAFPSGLSGLARGRRFSSAGARWVLDDLAQPSRYPIDYPGLDRKFKVTASQIFSS